MNLTRSIKWICFIVTACLFFGAARLYYYLTDDFRLSNISYPLPFELSWEVPSLMPQERQQLTQIFNQKFSYIGKGAQCYAFASEDQHYVLKFFKFKHLKPSLFIDLLPSIPPFKEYKQSYMERKRRKLLGLFHGYHLAYCENRQGSELLYLHLLPTQTLQQQVTVIDKMGWERQINLDEVIFLIQKRGETLGTRIKRLLNQHRLQDAEQAIATIIQMYISEYKKGIYDRDHGVMHNTGFVGEQPFHLDVGKLSKEENMQNVAIYKQDLQQVIWRMDRWIQTFYPQNYSQLSTFLAQEYQQWTGEAFDLSKVEAQRLRKRGH